MATQGAKVLLMGRAGAGKTSMRSIIFANYLARETSRLHPTNNVENSDLRFLGNLHLNLWDCGGQDVFMENYFESQRDHIFRNVAVEEKFERIFRVNREMRDETLVYDPFLTKFWAKMASECMENAIKISILGFSDIDFRV
jgi:GTPase SAR1 family protein